MTYSEQDFLIAFEMEDILISGVREDAVDYFASSVNV